MLLAFSPARFDAPGDSILIDFLRQQHLHPHRTVLEMLETARHETGFSRDASPVAVRLLKLDGATKIGRLTAADLGELSRTIRRLRGRSGETMRPASVA